VAFKYQRRVDDLAAAARTATRYMDVVTTSGPGTGLKAHRDKIAEMKNAIGGFPLGIASGITPENVVDYLDVADCFLVATGISDTFSELNPGRVRELVANVRRWEPGEPEIDEEAASPKIPSVCFVCEWNEGRSVHLELAVRRVLLEAGRDASTSSAGLSQGGKINPQRRRFLRGRGVPEEAITGHQATLFGDQHKVADLILVAELQMKERILRDYPDLDGRVMTVRGFLAGMTPKNEPISEADALIEDAGGHTEEEKLLLYEELEALAEQVADRLTGDPPG
jgi:protein-tyrosine-phosphatase